LAAMRVNEEMRDFVEKSLWRNVWKHSGKTCATAL
jgi:hypothetical protein